jgi:carboxypeptidase C (cathepsin A)
MIRPTLLFAFLTAALCPLATIAQQPPAPDAKKAEPEANDKDKEKGDDKPDRKVETKHSLTIGGVKVDYTATAGTLSLKDAEGKKTAEIFYIAYTKDNPAEAGKRPLTFSFNGGPGLFFRLDAHGPPGTEACETARRWFCRSAAIRTRGE